MIYFLQEIDPPHRIKIGYSANPKKRIATLAATLPQSVKILIITKGTKDDEQWLHKRWKEFRVEGKREWYYPYPELLEEIDNKKQS